MNNCPYYNENNPICDDSECYACEHYTEIHQEENSKEGNLIIKEE